MVVLAHQDAAPIAVLARSAGDVLANVAIAEVVDHISGGSTSIVEFADSTYERTTSATVDRNVQVVSAIPVSGYSSLDTGIATVDSDGKVTRVSDGTARIQVATSYGTAQFSVPVAREVSSVDAWLSYKNDTLAKYFSEQTWARVDGIPPSQAKSLYTTFPTRNQQCWCFAATPIDVTCIPRGTPNRNGTAITNRAVIHASHYAYPLGATVTFVGMNGQLFSTTVVDRVLDGEIGVTDIAIAKLADELPAFITPAKLMPADFKEHLPGVLTHLLDGVARGVPVCRTDQQGKLLTDDLFYAGSQVSVYTPLYAGVQQNTNSAPCWEAAIAGDSGSGIYAVIDDALVVLSSHSGQWNGPNYALYLDELQGALDDLDAGTLATVDLSAYPTYE